MNPQTVTLLSWLLPAMVLLGALAGVLHARQSIRKQAARACVALLSMLVAFLALELVHIQFFLKTDAFATTLASRRWLRLHFQEPVNSLGYRDVEHTAESFESRRSVIVVGDSFAAGYGVEDHRDRFSDVLAKQLGPEWAVANVAALGWNTTDMLEAIENFPHRADVVVLSYYVNDIEGAARSRGVTTPVRLPRPSGVVYHLTETSFLLNTLYWRLFRFRDGEEMGRRFAEHLAGCYADPGIWSTHQEELQAVVDGARSRGQELVAVLFPKLNDVQGSANLTSRVAEVFEREGVEVLDLAPVLAGREPSSIVVNPFDAHPNAALHREVGELLAERLSGLVSGD